MAYRLALLGIQTLKKVHGEDALLDFSMGGGRGPDL
jgi:hypothetical protein